MSYSKLDSDQIIKKVYDSGAEALRTTGGSITSEVEVTNPPGESLNVIDRSQLVPEEYDEVELTYVAAGNGVGEIETVTYSLSGSPVATLTLSYDGSNRLINVIRS